MVIDDDPVILEMVKDTLTYFGFCVNANAGTKDVLLLIEKQQPDLLLIDYILNGINGGELCHQVKTCPQTSKLPVILFSAYPNIVHSLSYYGCDAFIAKPFDMMELTGEIRRLLAHST
jgi:DNA-binding response OmpR family regulator